MDVVELLSSKPSRLNLTIGLVDHSWLPKQQFPDSVTNINIFHTSQERVLEQMSSNPCKFAASGDFMDWAETTWNKTGKGPKELDFTEDTVCNKNPFYKIPLPTEMTWPETKQTCNNLGHANITESFSKDDLDKFMIWFIREHGPCQDIWTPLTDQGEEGVFVSANSGQEANYIPWMYGQPNGGNIQNHLAIRRTQGGANNSFGYYDAKASNRFCSSCTLDKTTVFTLWGRCEFTFLDSAYVLITTRRMVQYSGVYSSNIW